MKFGREYEQALANEGFPEQWLGSAIDYKYLKKCIKKIHRELEDLGLDASTIVHLSNHLETDQSEQGRRRSSTTPHGFYSAEEPHLDTIPEEFAPQLRVLVDSKTGTPLDATLAPETKATLQHLAKHEMVTTNRHELLGHHATHEVRDRRHSADLRDANGELIDLEAVDARWVQIPLASAKNFFDLLAPKLEELDRLRNEETDRLETDILDLGEAVEDVVEPVEEGFEARRRVSYRDLYFWRAMFQMYIEKQVFYSSTEQNRGALTFAEAKSRLQAYDEALRSSGLMAKIRTPQAKKAAKMFLELNVNILKIMHFQEMNARAMSKIVKKFNKRTHLKGQEFLKDLTTKYPTLELTPSDKRTKASSGFANSIARDLYAELGSKVLAIIPQLDDWLCPVCQCLAWRPVRLGCCQARYCIRCVIKLQDDEHTRCPICNAESVMKANGRNIDFEAMDFLEKYFKMEVSKRQKENEQADLVRRYGEEFVADPKCAMM